VGPLTIAYATWVRRVLLGVLNAERLRRWGKAQSTVSREGDEVDQIRDIEHQRLRALVEADMDVARKLHAEDFQLITPFGDALSKEEYLGTVESGDIDYVVWKPEAIDVRVSGDMAVLRYSSRIEIVVGGYLLGTTGTRTTMRSATDGGRPCGRKQRRCSSRCLIHRSAWNRNSANLGE